MLTPSHSLRIANVAGYVFLIAVNVAAGFGWLGPSNEKLSKKNPTPITPAGWAFSIWGLIFLLQGVGVIYQSVNHGYEDGLKSVVVEAIGYWWIVGWIAQCLWQFSFQLQTPLGMRICMLCLLSGCASFARALNNLYKVSAEHGPIPASLYTAYFLPTSINTAWISVASCIGILIVASVQGVPRLEIGALILAATTTAAGVAALGLHRDIAYGATLIWALAAVAAKQDRVPVGNAALICVAINALGIAYAVLKKTPDQAAKPLGAYTEL